MLVILFAIVSLSKNCVCAIGGWKPGGEGSAAENKGSSGWLGDEPSCIAECRPYDEAGGGFESDLLIYIMRAPLKHHLMVRALYKTPFNGARTII